MHPLTPYYQPTNFKAINDDKVDFISTALGVRTEMGVEMVRAAMECVQLFDTKQQDYGSNNISSSGELGIAVRLQDKVSRMRHILLKELTAQEKSAHVFKANHESLEDTYKDAANYALIGLVAAQTVEIIGQWFLPMGVESRISRLPLFFRNSEKHKFTWKTI